ncbi:MAG: FKBP-type peptidyl-prolyl cis-trans isomerase [Vicinamibacterales bacterium]
MNWTRYVLFLLVCSLTVAIACGGEDQADATGAAESSAAAETGAPVADVASLQVTDTKPGTGAEAVAGQQVSVHYTGWLYSPGAENQRGTKFDSSVDRGEPFAFRLGAGQVIRGWDEGVAGMKVGGTRTLVIPSAMGYGSRGAGGVIPPNAALVFDVELLGVQ